ncbi:MAG: PAS-domain containing protein [Gammaproteobacteria bacterium]|nr:PAS-domain containing protein [Gammaproteobacteria bacterium]
MRAVLGLRGRLLLAFFSISGFAVVAAVAAMYSFIAAGNALERITLDRVPATIASQQLSRQAEKIVAIAPALPKVNNYAEHAQLSNGIAAELELLERQLAELKTLDVDAEHLQPIENRVFLMRIHLNTVDTMVFNYLVLAERRTDLLRELSFTDVSARRLLAPGLLVMDAKLDEARKQLQPAGSGNRQPAEIEALARPIIELAPVQAAQAQVAAINDTLIEIASAATRPDVEVLGFPLRRSLDELAQSIARMEPLLAQRLQQRLDEFRRYASGNNSLTHVRGLELAQLGLIDGLLEQNSRVSRELTTAVDRLVTATNEEIRAANREAQAVQQTATTIMLLVVGLSLVCSGLVGWLYVGRSLIRRLTGLNRSMLAIAGGDLDAAIPTGGGDEISRMADALVVFRDTAVEVRESNLREIRAARQRLSDAIESIDEAFSLYDRDDRLVLCNSRYRELFAPIADVIDAGTPFETIVRRAAESELFDVADADIDAWVEKRMRRFHRRSGPKRERLRDGRWLQIDEAETEEGGTVAVYSDITELVEQSQQLEAWNHDLEARVERQVEELQRVEQLKRYFPPQLTDAILSDSDPTTLEDHRREISAVFCDLRGYTEFSTTADPREELRVLREYHGVICPLIFEYGATLEHFAGDGVMAFLNDPVPDPEHILRAVQMADAMRRGMQRLRADWQQRGIDMGFGVGIGTGLATLGKLGTETQFHYAAIGTVANLAARLSDMAKHDEILVHQRVVSEIEGEFEVEAVGELTLKGFPKPVAAFNVVDVEAPSVDLAAS